MDNIKEQILADAIQTAIETEMKLQKLKKENVVMWVVNFILLLYILWSRFYG